MLTFVIPLRFWSFVFFSVHHSVTTSMYSPCASRRPLICFILFKSDVELRLSKCVKDRKVCTHKMVVCQLIFARQSKTHQKMMDQRTHRSTHGLMVGKAHSEGPCDRTVTHNIKKSIYIDKLDQERADIMVNKSRCSFLFLG